MIEIKTAFMGCRMLLDTDDLQIGQKFAEHIAATVNASWPGGRDFEALATLVEDDGEIKRLTRLVQEAYLEGHDDGRGNYGAWELSQAYLTLQGRQR